MILQLNPCLICGKPLRGRAKKYHLGECERAAMKARRKMRGKTVEIRKKVFKRDSGYCVLCWRDASLAWEADHIVPISLGGPAKDLSNIRTLCIPCHRRVTSEFRRTIKEARVMRNGAGLSRSED